MPTISDLSNLEMILYKFGGHFSWEDAGARNMKRHVLLFGESEEA